MDRSSDLLDRVLGGVKWLGKNAVVAGIIGGLFFAVVSPFATPTLAGWQAETGTFVDKPDIKVQLSGPSEVPDPNETVTYSVWVKNTENRLAEDIRFTFYFKGCPVDRGFYGESGKTYSNPGIEFDSSDCFETVYVPNLAKGEELVLEYTVEGREPSEIPTLMVSAGQHTDFGYRAEYQWNLNGMTFAEKESDQINISYAPF